VDLQILRFVLAFSSRGHYACQAVLHALCIGYDFEAAAKERIYYSHLDGYNTVNPECDIDAHVKKMRACLKTMPIGGLEYLVAKDLKIHLKMSKANKLD
jgi:hypothetical protein